VQSINVTNRGINYSKAIITITGGSGYGATATAVLDSKFGTLRTVYFNENAERQIINENAGSINYDSGEVIITNIRVVSVVNADSSIRVDVESQSGIISSVRNTILTIDKTDPSAISTEFTTG
jgi:hypothetical protein